MNEKHMTITNKLMIWWTAVIAITGIVSAVLFGCQLMAMKGQIDEMAIEQRPWIKVDVVPAGPFRFFSKSSGGLPLEINLSNVGKNPAFHVQAVAFAFLLTATHNDVQTEEKRRCDSIQTSPDTQNYGITLFPGDIRSWSDQGATYAAAFTEDEFKQNHITQDGKEIMDFWVYGCVSYVFGEPKKHHQTGFIYRVIHVVGKSAAEYTIEPATVLNSGGQIQTKDIKFLTVPGANGYTD